MNKRKIDPLSDPRSPQGAKGNGEYWLKNGWTGPVPINPSPDAGYEDITDEEDVSYP